MLQHPERVVPLSECERFEPHFQPNVALAPITTPSMPPVPPPPPVNPHRRHNHERRRNNHCPTSPTIEKTEPLSVNVKLEKPSTPGPESAGGSYPPLLSCTTDGADCHEDQVEDRLEGKQQLQQQQQDEQDHEEEESSAAVTSSTVTMEPPPAEVGTSSPESDSESENGGPAVELEERLLALDSPQDVLALARQVALENSRLKHRHRLDTREIARLRSQLEMQRIQSVSEVNVKNYVANASAADSTECSEDTEVALPSENKESEAPLIAASND